MSNYWCDFLTETKKADAAYICATLKSAYKSGEQCESLCRDALRFMERRMGEEELTIERALSHLAALYADGNHQDDYENVAHMISKCSSTMFAR